MIQNKINNLIFTAIFLLCIKMLSCHKKVEKGTTVTKERASILKDVQCNVGIFQTSCKGRPYPFLILVVY